ncbi:MAG TPA: amidohydrolase, partial [Mizugakiibacter sp.]
MAQTPAADTPTAFVAVNVVPMDRERVLRNQTVLVEDGRIVAIGRKVAVPKGARIVDGHGRAYLSPGLADMHMHADTAEALKVYLANGVTSVLNMGGASPEFVAQLRPAVNAGKRPGPHVYAAFIVDGSPRYGHFFVTTPEEARWTVRLAKTNGYDFIKVYNDLSPECFQALVDEGRVQHLPVVGHGVRSVGLERQLDAGQLMVAHAEEFLYTVFKTAADAPPGSAPDAAQIPGAIAFVQRDHAFVTADLNTYATIARQWGRPEVVDGILHGPELRYVSPA